jgi:large subunit ribosomal protein L21e
MAQKSKGMRRKTRKKLTKDEGRTGRIAAHLQEFEEGEQVLIDVDPAVQDGMPHPRFHGRTAIVDGERGRSFVITLKDGGKEKEFAVHPAHLRALDDR